MIYLRYLLFPFGILYYSITGIRNWLYSSKIYKSSEFDLPIVSVGNLSTGGTGKSPHVEYLIRLLKKEYKTAVLSRGYGRKKSGFQKAKEISTAEYIGDEPLQFYTKFKEDIGVYVDAKRVMGVINLLQEEPLTDVVILDDAYQHRAIKPGFSILISDYNKPFYTDYILPVGNLRESRNQYTRANTIIISKCPSNLSPEKQKQIINKVKPLSHQTVYFSYIKYGEIKSFNIGFKPMDINSLKEYAVLLFTGIANDKPLRNELENKQIKYSYLSFPDHHTFTNKNISNIIDIFENLSGEKKLILTTEKDAVRIKNNPKLKNLPMYYMEIEIDFINYKLAFDQQILNYVKQNKRDS